MTSEVLNILAIDDERAVTASIRAGLKSLGHSVDVLQDGDDAFTHLMKSPDHYQILITDHLMCRFSGLDLLEKLKRKAFHGRIIVLSAFLTSKLEAEYRALGADRIMRKPFDLHELRMAVEELKQLPAA